VGLFEEIRDPGPPSKGWADLELKASEGTHLENPFFLDYGYDVVYNITIWLLWKWKGTHSGRRSILYPRSEWDYQNKRRFPVPYIRVWPLYRGMGKKKIFSTRK
jgi:hypothetical protein